MNELVWVKLDDLRSDLAIASLEFHQFGLKQWWRPSDHLGASPRGTTARPQGGPSGAPSID